MPTLDDADCKPKFGNCNNASYRVVVRIHSPSHIIVRTALYCQNKSRRSQCAIATFRHRKTIIELVHRSFHRLSMSLWS